MNFHESESYLLSLGNEFSTMKLGLENIRTLLAALGDPQNNYLKVQVAGTNGKGSVCAFLNSICVSAGIKTGMYTSPHLISITERIQIDRREISEDDFAKFATHVRETSERLAAADDIDNIPTFFEQVTAIALLAFAEANVELAILETGLGGRLDATTAADADVKAITRIDLDHQNYLGDTLEEIAAEKAAIIQDQFDNVVIGAQQPLALDVILERCRQLGTVPVGDRYRPWKVEENGPSSVRVETTIYVFPEVTLGLQGRHQIENAETAINVMQSLHYDCGLGFEEEAVMAGLRDAHHPGRLDWIGRFLLDGAHNIGGAAALRDYLNEFVDRRITMIFGAMSDKDIGSIGAILFPKAERVVLTRPDNTRAAEPSSIEGVAARYIDRERIYVTENAGEALKKASQVSGKRDVILATGSLYLVGEVRSILTAKPPEKLKTEN